MAGQRRRPDGSDAKPRGASHGAAVNGFLNLYKPAGITAMGALRRVKGITGQRKKVGHAGTLDPLAEGALPVCFGQATRLMEQVVSGGKRYRMTVRLGATSNTYDAEGDITETGNAEGLTREEIAVAAQQFVGVIDQVPPMYSALKVGGQRLYDLARSGKEVPRAARQVEVQSIRIDGFAPPDLDLTVDCGRGTYLRSIAHDLGQALGCGGYVIRLSRLRCGQFEAAEGVTMEVLAAAAEAGDWRRHLHPVDWALLGLGAMEVSAGQAEAIRHGQGIPAGDSADPAGIGEECRAYDGEGFFLGLLQYRADGGRWHPRRVFDSAEPSPYAPGRL